jgi:hypothetical protein
MNLKPTIQGYLAAMQEARDEDRALTQQEARLLRDLEKIRSLKVGVRERILKAHEALSIAQSQQVRYEVTARDREVAHMKGLPVLKVGEELTFEFKSLLYGS